jgi:hypothetical protein
MKCWVETRFYEPPPDVTISGRFGCSVMFVAYDKLLKRWLWLQPNGIVERIEEPPEIYIDESWIADHRLINPRPKPSGKIHKHKGDEQLFLI